MRTVQPYPAARGRPTRPGGMDRSPGLPWAGPPAPSRRPEHGRFSPPLWARDGPVKRTGVEHGPAEGVPHSRRTLSPAPKRHGTDQIMAWDDSSSKDSAPRGRAPPQQLAPWRRSRPVRLIHRGGRAEGDMRSSAVQPPNALLLSRTRRPWPARATGRLQCKGHMVWKPAAVSAFDLAQRCRSSTLRVQQEVRSGALQPVNALPHGKARRIRSAHATDGLQCEGGSTLIRFTLVQCTLLTSLDHRRRQTSRITR